MLHPARVASAVYWSTRTSLRQALGIRRKGRSAVLSSGAGNAFQRYHHICRFYLARLQEIEGISGHTVCEVGCGDSLASADLLLGLGASHVDLIETQKITINDVQKTVLQKCADSPDLPNRNEVLTPGGTIDSAKITVIAKYLEHVEGEARYHLMLSHDVLEHVEDIDGFFGNCHRLLHPKGLMIHKIDLSGHEFFEDPLPPLDFQTYPDWLYAWMFPKYRRATRRLQGEYLEAIRRAGFQVTKAGILRAADSDYVEKIKPRLRRSIRQASIDELQALDWYVVAQKL